MLPRANINPAKELVVCKRALISGGGYSVIPNHCLYELVTVIPDGRAVIVAFDPRCQAVGSLLHLLEGVIRVWIAAGLGLIEDWAKIRPTYSFFPTTLYDYQA
jgi:hypothetical protein